MTRFVSVTVTELVLSDAAQARAYGGDGVLHEWLRSRRVPLSKLKGPAMADLAVLAIDEAVEWTAHLAVGDTFDAAPRAPADWRRSTSCALPAHGARRPASVQRDESATRTVVSSSSTSGPCTNERSMARQWVWQRSSTSSSDVEIVSS